MPRPSSVDRLEPEVRLKITALRDKGKTIDEIMAALNTIDPDHEVSRSALGRHIKRADQVALQMRNSRVIAESIGRNFGDDETSLVARTNVEMLHSFVMQIMLGQDDADGPVIIDAKTAALLATALEKLSKTSSIDFAMQLKAAVEKERKSTAEKAVEKVETMGRKQGLSAEAVQAFRAEMLGIS